MTPKQELDWRRTHTPPLFEAIQDVLAELGVSAHVSFAVCEEAIIHHGRDIDRLYVTHHKLVHPTKHCSYLAFWVRKLKPISRAFPKDVLKNVPDGESPEISSEITDINEQVSIHIALRSLALYIKDGHIILQDIPSKKEALLVFQKVVRAYLLSKTEDGMSMGNRFSMLTYDMRFRTFGPHHLTHVFVHILREMIQFISNEKMGGRGP